MNNNLEKRLSVFFVNGQEDEKQRILEQTYRIAVESITGNITKDTVEFFETISSNLEKIGNSINISDDYKKTAYDYGVLYGIVNMFNGVVKKTTEDAEAVVFTKKYKHLTHMLAFINDNKKVTGQQIIKEFSFKNGSNLTNFMGRIKKYDLIYIQKIGTVNYYSLTQKGKKVYSKNKAVNRIETHTSQNSVSEYVVLNVLDTIAKQIAVPEPKTSEVIKVFVKNHASIENKSVLKLKIESVFSSRNKYIKDMLNKPIVKNTETEISQTKSMDLLRFGYDDSLEDYLIEDNKTEYANYNWLSKEKKCCV